jgi:hypothetical protein
MGIVGALLLAFPLAQPTAATSESKWYGWQTLLADGVTVAMIGGSLQLKHPDRLEGKVLGTSALLVDLLGAPWCILRTTGSAL